MKSKKNTPDVRAVVERLDSYCRNLIAGAAELAYQEKHAVLAVEHLLLMLFRSDDSKTLDSLTKAGLDHASAKAQIEFFLKKTATVTGLPPALSSDLVDILQDAWLIVSLKNSNGAVDIDSLLNSIFSNDVIISQLAETVPAFKCFSFEKYSTNEMNTSEGVARVAVDSLHGSALAKFTVNLNEQVIIGKVDPVVGRENEISQLIEILMRRRQNNPILTGEAGVGKTAIVEGLVQRICAGLVPDALKSVVIHSLDMGLLKAGAGVKGEIEARLKQIMLEISTSPKPIILFIDEAHTLVGGSSSEHNDIANLVKPELARGTLRTIAATTWSEYKRFFEKDAALSRRFQVVKVNEPSPEDAVKILQGLLPTLQVHHGVYILQSAVSAAVELSSRYIQSRQLPDKAISVLDTACARAVAALSGPAAEQVNLKQHAELLRGQISAIKQELDWNLADSNQLLLLKNDLISIEARLKELSEGNTSSKRDVQKKASRRKEKTVPVHVGPKDIASVVADWTGIPSNQMLTDQSARVLGLESKLENHIVDQSRAVRVICNRLQAYALSLEDPSRPIGVFMLVGPSGVGKTETAHVLANSFFAGDQSITVINMSEYQEAHTVSKLKGAPPGYVGYGQGGVLTEAIRRRPYGLLLLDEIEKAHPDVLDLFLQVFDKGFMEDGEGTKVDFKNTLIILTSNAASDVFDKHLESIRKILPEQTDEQVFELFNRELNQELLLHFRAAFLGRIQVVPYMPLESKSIRRIVALRLALIAQRFKTAYSANVDFSESLVDLIVSRCTSSSLGARLIDQFIASRLLPQLSAYILHCMSVNALPQSTRLDVVNGELALNNFCDV